MDLPQGPVISHPPSSRRHAPIPPWSRPGDPVGRAITSHRVDPELTTRAQAFSTACGMTLDRLWVAAWVATWARCLGENEIVTAVVSSAGELHEVEMPHLPETWMDLVSGLEYRDLQDASAAQAVLSLTVTGGDEHAGFASLQQAPLQVTVHETDDGLILEVCHRTETVSAASAQRLLGYLEAMLAAVVSDGLSAPADLSRILGEAEIAEQLTGRIGHVVSNGPDQFLDHFRHRATDDPDAPAIVHQGRQVTYGELERASRRIAAGLVEAGVQMGDAVAVVTDRHADWIAMILGVLRAGGVYLPVRPDFPASRVADQFRHAECRVAVTDAAGGGLVNEMLASGAWNGTHAPAANLLQRELDNTALPRPKGTDAAYIYFTSGSTGQPKGAVCEHAGMVNHLWAKIDDHAITPSDVASQTASQSFDISLWQVCAPLMVGGSVVVVDTEDQLDIDVFLDLLDEHGVSVAQIVPSYLEILLARTEAGRKLPRSLRSLSVTGEALKADLVRRWFSMVDGVELVNAYGATEVSDDTMHNVLRSLPERPLPIVNVGRALRNVRVYIVDELLRLMPVGARGEIVFAGVCVGRGYINDEDLTAAAFDDDPYVPGERLYHSGDYGRWLPEGGIEFLGRLDEQVKIRGLRIEIGDIQSAILRVPGIAEVAVVTVGDGNGAGLAAFYTGSADVVPNDLHDLLSTSLPEYMIPSFLHHVESLPLNENGKVDKRALRELAEILQSQGAPYEPPATPTEERLAVAWAEVLGLPAGQIGRNDDFFQLGGTSLAAVHLVMRLDKQLSLRDIAAAPTLRAQAELLGAEPESPPAPQRLLHRVGRRLDGPGPVAICLPGAAGNALNFRAAAEAAHGAGIDLLALEPRGHDIARPEEELLGLPRTVDLLVGEVVRLGATSVHLWGQGTGAPTAVALAIELSRAGSPPAHVFLAGATLGSVEEHQANRARAASMSTDEIIDVLQQFHGYVEVAGMDERRRELVAAAYRHDVIEAERFLEQILTDPERHRIDCPVTVVLARDDLYTPDLSRGRNWSLIADPLDWDLLVDAGTDLLRRRPKLLADHIRSLDPIRP